MMSKEKPMRYRGFEITSTADYDIHRMNRMTGDVEVCKGYYCEVYDANDVGLINMFDSFCLAEGWADKSPKAKTSPFEARKGSEGQMPAPSRQSQTWAVFEPRVAK